MAFLSNGSIDFDADCGMMDLWAASNLLKMKGDELYISGMQTLRNELAKKQAEEDAKDPTKRITIATGPLKLD